MSDLKPCPFCGSDDVFVERGSFSSSFVMCNNCVSRGPDCDPETQADLDAEEKNGWDSGEAAARRRWNTRPPVKEVETV